MAAESSPLHQFTIERIAEIHIGGFDLSFTNSALFMTLAAVLVTVLMVLATRGASEVPGRLQSLAEMLYDFIADMIEERAGSDDLTVIHYDGLYHELLNEPERERVVGDIADWLDAHTTD